MIFRGTANGRAVLGAVQPAASERFHTLDLSRMTFCEPIALVAIACRVEASASAGHSVIVQAPSDRGVANYLARMRLGYWLSALGAMHDLPTVRERPHPDALIELTSFDGARGAEQLARLVHRAASRVATGNAAPNVLFDAISEAGDNVETHSGRRRGFA